MKYTANKKNNAFTLIELLVVIAIIALLLTILLPSLRLAKAQGKGILCRSNIRQLAMSNLVYASDSNDYFVAAASDLWDSSGGLNRWHGTRGNADDAFDASRGPLSSYLGDGRAKECPEKIVFHKGQSWDDSFEKGCGGYGYNMTYIGSTHWRSGVTTIEAWKNSYARTTRRTQVTQSSETLMFTDTAFLQGQNLIEYSFAEPRYWFLNGELDLSASPSPTIHFRHNLRTNIAWVDGHVSSLEMPKQYDGVNAYLETYREHSLGMIEPFDNSLFDLK
jgi:prepilin-type N-terminal cleavage/methylation domain-containing protein/prepilin-type processing-associated H-X9-DG protein